jgi:hypothetical protein
LAAKVDLSRAMLNTAGGNPSVVHSKEALLGGIFVAIIEREAWEAGTDDPPTARFTSPVEGPFLFPGALSFE